MVSEITGVSSFPWHLAFTINSIRMAFLPRQEVQNGDNLTLQCIVDISTTSHAKPQYQLLFYKDDTLFHNVSSTESTESYFIAQARVYNAGIYKCTVLLNNKERTTSEYKVLVKSESLALNVAQADKANACSSKDRS